MNDSNNMHRTIGIAALAILFGAGGAFAQSSSSSTSSQPQSPAVRSSSGASSDSAGSSSGSASQGKISRADEGLMKDLAKANISEIETSKLVAGKTQNDQVKQFAQKMVDDHTQAMQQLQQLAQQKGVTLPTDPDMKHKAEMKLLSAMDGDKLDKSYMKHGGLADHSNTHKLLAKIQSKAQDADLKALAGKLMPIVDQHLAQAKTIAGSKSAANMSGSSMGPAGTSGTTSSGSSGSTGSTGGTGASGTSGSSNSTSPSK